MQKLLLLKRIHHIIAIPLPQLLIALCSAKAGACYDSCSPTLTQGDINCCHALVSRLIQNTPMLFVWALIGWTGKCAALEQTLIATTTMLVPFYT